MTAGRDHGDRATTSITGQGPQPRLGPRSADKGPHRRKARLTCGNGGISGRLTRPTDDPVSGHVDRQSPSFAAIELRGCPARNVAASPDDGARILTVVDVGAGKADDRSPTLGRRNGLRHDQAGRHWEYLETAGASPAPGVRVDRRICGWPER